MSELETFKKLVADARTFLDALGVPPKELTGKWNDLVVSTASAEACLQTPNQSFKIRVAWGSESFRKDSEMEPEEFSFQTAAELDAFTLGVSEASGYMDYEFIQPNEDGSWPEPKEDDDGEENEAGD